MNDMSDMLRMLCSLTSISIYVILQLVFLLIALLVVRARRKDAAWPFIVSAILGLLHSIGAPTTTYLLFEIGSRYWEFETTAMISSVLMIVRALVQTGIFGLTLYGIIRLAKPPPVEAKSAG